MRHVFLLRAQQAKQQSKAKEVFRQGRWPKPVCLPTYIDIDGDGV